MHTILDAPCVSDTRFRRIIWCSLIFSITKRNISSGVVDDFVATWNFKSFHLQQSVSHNTTVFLSTVIESQMQSDCCFHSIQKKINSNFKCYYSDIPTLTVCSIRIFIVPISSGLVGSNNAINKYGNCSQTEYYEWTGNTQIKTTK